MSILSKLMGSAQGAAANTTRGAGRGTTGKGMGGGRTRATGGRGTPASGFGGFRGNGRATTGRASTGRATTGRLSGGRGAPARSGGLGRLLGSLTGRR
jgi:hypothetical protein